MITRFEVGEQVWLRPKTLGCPTICWSQPQVTVVSPGNPHVKVRLPGGRTLTVHEDNISRSQPKTAEPAPRPAKPRLPMLGGEEVPLW